MMIHFAVQLFTVCLLFVCWIGSTENKLTVTCVYVVTFILFIHASSVQILSEVLLWSCDYCNITFCVLWIICAFRRTVNKVATFPKMRYVYQFVLLY